MRGKGGIVASAVLCVKHESKIKEFGFKWCVITGDTQHTQGVFCRGQSFFRAVDNQTLPAVVVLIRLIAVNRQHREGGDEKQALTQDVFRGYVVRIIVIGVKSQHAAR